MLTSGLISLTADLGARCQLCLRCEIGTKAVQKGAHVR